MCLNEIGTGKSCIVKQINGNGPLQKRLMDFGITPGVQIKVEKVAPLGDPVEIKLRGYKLSLRKSEAAVVEIRKNFF